MAEPLSQEESSLNPPFSMPRSEAMSGAGRRSTAPRLLPRTATDQPLGAWPTETQEHRYDEAARNVGSAVGMAVDKAKHLPVLVKNSADEVRSRLTEISSRAAQEVKNKAADLRQNAQEQILSARKRAQYVADEYPLQFILGAAGVGLMVGFVLRLWRDRD